MGSGVEVASGGLGLLECGGIRRICLQKVMGLGEWAFLGNHNELKTKDPNPQSYGPLQSCDSLRSMSEGGVSTNPTENILYLWWLGA